MSKPAQLIPELCIGHSLPAVKNTMSHIDALVYQIGIGYARDPMNEEELPYVFEMHEDFAVFPTNFAITRGVEIFEVLVSCPGMPQFNPMRLLHGENKIEVIKQLDIETPYLTIGSIGDVVDKGKGALVTIVFTTYEENDDGSQGDLCIIQYSSMFIRGIGGFGFKGKNP
jgi:hypothetical protein